MTTDLIEISKAEVIEKAKILARVTNGPDATAIKVRLASENLLAAVTLLESREAMKTEDTVSSMEFTEEEMRELAHGVIGTIYPMLPDGTMDGKVSAIRIAVQEFLSRMLGSKEEK